MASDTHKEMPATDSAKELHDLIGDDATATFESDPKFLEPTPGSEGSSENIEEQKAAGESPHALRADGLLGYEDEAQDVEEKRDRAEGDKAREKEQAKIKDGEAHPIPEDELRARAEDDALDSDDPDRTMPGLHKADRDEVEPVEEIEENDTDVAVDRAIGLSGFYANVASSAAGRPGLWQ